jgi:hypothetical protein
MVRRVKRKPAIKRYASRNLMTVVILFVSLIGVAVALKFFQSQVLNTRSSAMMGGSRDECMVNGMAATDQMAFCDLFIVPAQAPFRGRGGDLDIRRWSFARLTSDVNPGQNAVNDFPPAVAQFCRIQKTVKADNDSFFCGLEFNEPNHWMETINDGGNYAMNSARITQPFDFANRTGVISFDVDAHTLGEHDIWPEIWITDEPVQAPHLDHPGTHEYPRNGVGFVINNTVNASANALRHISVFRNYQETDYQASGNTFTTGPDQANHFEIHISQNKIEFWGSDKDGSNFKLRDTFNVSVPLTRGYVHFQQAQYNAAKDGPTNTGTFHWHGLGFDGPVLPADRTYQVPDSLTGNVNTGYVSPFTYTFQNVDISNVKQAYLTLDTYYFDNAKGINYTINGHAHSQNSQQSTGYQWNYIVIPLNTAELNSGSNTVTISTIGGCTFACTTLANIDLDLVLNDTAPFSKFVNPPVPCVTPYPGYTAAPCGGVMPTDTSMVMPTDTSMVMPTDTQMMMPTSTPTNRPTPTPTNRPTPTTFVPTPTTPVVSGTTINLGFTSRGGSIDVNDSNYMNGSRFKTGSVGGNTVSMSVFVGNTSSAPNNQYQMAIYSDNGGQPGALLARTGSGTLVSNSWNTLSLSTHLNANTNYWLMYNTNGANQFANNMRYGSSGRDAYSSNPVSFGSWPSSFGSSVVGSLKFSIYVTYKP